MCVAAVLAVLAGLGGDLVVQAVLVHIHGIGAASCFDVCVSVSAFGCFYPFVVVYDCRNGGLTVVLRRVARVIPFIASFWFPSFVLRVSCVRASDYVDILSFGRGYVSLRS